MLVAIACITSTRSAGAENCQDASKRVRAEDITAAFKQCSDQSGREKIRNCALDKLAMQFPSDDAKCFRQQVGTTAQFMAMVRGISEAAPTNGHCLTEDPRSHACVCGPAEYAAWRRDTDYTPSDFERIAVEAFVTPLTIGMGFDAVQFIKLVKQFAGALQKPHCFAKLSNDSAAELGASIDAVLKQYDWHRWNTPDGACTVPTEAWIQLGQAFSRSDFYNYVPLALQPGVQDRLAPKLKAVLHSASPADRAVFQSLFAAVRQVRDEMDRDRRDLVTRVDASILAFDRIMLVAPPSAPPVTRQPLKPAHT